jgi:hypothetical protein
MDKKTMYILAAALVVIIVVVGVGAYVFLYGGLGGGGGGGNGGGTQEDTYVVGNATSLQFSVDVTPAQGEASTVNYFAKNTGTSNVLLRVEIDAGEFGNLIYIFGSDHKAWTNATGTWEDISADYATNWEQWNPLFDGYVGSLAHWESGDYTYTAENGDSVRIYGIQVNPELADSLFQAPT